MKIRGFFRLCPSTGGFLVQIVDTRSMADTEPRYVLHMAPIDRWDQVASDPDGTYRDPSLDAEGFIHCSTHEQVLIPANERFAGRTDLVLLVVDLQQVPSHTVFEDCYESGHAFPHIYGEIPVASVVDVVPFPCQDDGTFSAATVPETLR